MNHNKSDSADLSSLIDQAQHAVTSRSENLKGQKTQSKSNLLGLAFPFAALIISGYMSYSLWADHMPPSKQKVGKDLEHILYQARDAIEGNRGPDGELPESIPNASLAAIVQFDADTNRYKLSTTIMGVRVTLEQDGKTITQIGETK